MKTPIDNETLVTLHEYEKQLLQHFEHLEQQHWNSLMLTARALLAVYDQPEFDFSELLKDMSQNKQRYLAVACIHGLISLGLDFKARQESEGAEEN